MPKRQGSEWQAVGKETDRHLTVHLPLPDFTRPRQKHEVLTDRQVTSYLGTETVCQGRECLLRAMATGLHSVACSVAARMQYVLHFDSQEGIPAAATGRGVAVWQPHGRLQGQQVPLPRANSMQGHMHRRRGRHQRHVAIQAASLNGLPCKLPALSCTCQRSQAWSLRLRGRLAELTSAGLGVAAPVAQQAIQVASPQLLSQVILTPCTCSLLRCQAQHYRSGANASSQSPSKYLHTQAPLFAEHKV